MGVILLVFSLSAALPYPESVGPPIERPTRTNRSKYMCVVVVVVLIVDVVVVVYTGSGG